ncbi:MAG: hypothetical protein ACHQ1D_11515, partial [Nitrososphaerales archaeon]
KAYNYPNYWAMVTRGIGHCVSYRLRLLSCIHPRRLGRAARNQTLVDRLKADYSIIELQPQFGGR